MQEPLRKIQTFSGMIHDNPEDPELRDKFLPKINKAAGHMSELIRQVLNFSRLSNGQELPEPVDLNVVLNEVFSEFDLLLEEKEARLQCAKLPVVQGVHHQLVQLFRNLVGNSLKFCTGRPHIDISYETVPASALPQDITGNTAQQYALIRLRDNGIGFDQEYADKIFLIFRRLNNKDQYAGTGVGLALCKRSWKTMEGLSWRIAKVVKGLYFLFTSPCNQLAMRIRNLLSQSAIASLGVAPNPMMPCSPSEPNKQ
ncbi:ATP-binding protein [Chitinophaga sedimenti]|uniref:sensor histidine kinase n=1 Tax=Chitinophaga sedimenti TaxID=2033606 RepID=UPI0020049593|nr:ATP-binding protein [Chitinophaga sedimenti]MCK7554277.1 ATP-binding protein [Chitinophaga sedimenti]